MLKKLKPILDKVRQVAVELLKYWRKLPIGWQIATFPVIIVAIVVIGIITYLYGCGCKK